MAALCYNGIVILFCAVALHHVTTALFILLTGRLIKMITIHQIKDYLSKNITDPLPKYIFLKEILKKPPSSPEYVDAYNGMVQTKWYRELADEQNEDGSWGAWRVDGYYDRSVKLKFKDSPIALRRASEMGLTKDDPMVAKCLNILEKYITGEVNYPERIVLGEDEGKTDTVFRDLGAVTTINLYDPHNPLIKPLQESAVEVYRMAFANGYFNEGYFNQAVYEYRIYVLCHPRCTGGLSLVRQAECMDESLQRSLLNYVWGKTSAMPIIKGNNPPYKRTKEWIVGDEIPFMANFLPIHKKVLEDKEFTIWLSLLELLSGFSLFGEIMREETYPHLLGEADRLVHGDIDLPKASGGHGRDFGGNTNGRYSDNWREKNKHKTDMVLRIARILVKC
jgi:hypothetical protein